MLRMQFDRPGGAEQIKAADVAVPEPGPGEVLVRHSAIGVNFIDTYHRSGLYEVPLPSGLGLEAAGAVETIGEGVTTLSVGDRVAYCSGPIGAYAEAHVVPAENIVKLPDSMSENEAAASLLKGLTVQYLIRQIYPVTAGETVLFQAAAGGCGLIACQWLKSLGATVIGTAGSEEKAALARAHGCDHVILYREENVAVRVVEITGGRRVPVVFDGVGKDTFEASLDSLQVRGLMVSFGNASGPVENLNLGILAAKGSLSVTRPTLFHFATDQASLQAMADDYFAAVAAGSVKTEIRQEYQLADAAQAHLDLEARRTIGSTVLRP